MLDEIVSELNEDLFLKQEFDYNIETPSYINCSNTNQAK